MSRAGSVSIRTFAAVAAGRRFIIATASRWRPADLPRLLTIDTTPEGCDLSSPLRAPWKSDPFRWVSCDRSRDRQSVVWGKSVSVRVDLGGRWTLKKKNQFYTKN